MICQRPQSLSFRRAHLFAALLSVLTVLLAPLAASAAPRAGHRGFTVDRYISSAEIDGVAALGANLVYYFFDPNNTTVADNHDDYIVSLNNEIARLDELLPLFAAHGIKVAVDMYGPPGGFADKTAPSWQAVFKYAWAQDTLIEAWQLISTHYKGNTAIFGYNLLNEPAQRAVGPGLASWKALSVLIANAIRAIDPDVLLILQPPYGDPNRFGSGLAPLKKSGNVEYSFNMYYPYTFTHQGLYGIPVKTTYKPGKKARAKMLAFMTRALKFKKKAKAPMYVAEFTAVRWAPNGSAAKYLADVCKVLESQKFDWSYHTYGGVDGSPDFAYPWSVLHSNNPHDSTPAAGETDRAAVLRACFKKNK